MTVGNDIVDLRDPESVPASLHGRYLERVFTAHERLAILDRPDPVELWSRWAAKEAAYKALAGDRPPGQPELVFSPRAFVTELDPPGAGPHRDGWVLHSDQDLALPVRVHCLDGAVHAVATTERDVLDRTRVVTAAFRLDEVRLGEAEIDRPSLAVRRAARRHLAQNLGCDVRRVKICGRRPPRFVLDGQLAAASLSLSHHGDWVAYAFSHAQVAAAQLGARA